VIGLKEQHSALPGKEGRRDDDLGRSLSAHRGACLRSQQIFIDRLFDPDPGKRIEIADGEALGQRLFQSPFFLLAQMLGQLVAEFELRIACCMRGACRQERQGGRDRRQSQLAPG